MGLVVKDVGKKIECLSYLDIGPSELVTEKHFSKKKIKGKPVDYRLKIRLAQVKPVQIELLQPKEFLENRGEGICHLGFFVKNIDK